MSTFRQHPEMQSLLDDLDQDGPKFLSATCQAIGRIIRNKSTAECLSLVTRSKSGKISHYPARPTPQFAWMLFLFCCKKPYKKYGWEYQLDSALTDEIVELFQQRYEKFFSDRDDKISKAVLSALASDESVKRALAAAVCANEGVRLASKELQKEIVDQFFAILAQTAKEHLDGVGGQLTDSLAAAVNNVTTTVAGTTMGKTIMVKVGTVAGGIVSSHMINVIAFKIMVIIASKIQLLVIKAMAMPAIKTLIIAAAKKVIIGAVIAALFKLIVVKLSLSTGAVISIVVAPLVTWYLVSQWNSFPEKLGDSIEEELKKEFRSQFRITTEAVLKNVWDYLLSHGVSEIGEVITGDEDLAKAASVTRKVLPT